MSRVVVTGSAGHLGEALMRTFADEGREAIGIDVIASRFTREVGSVLDRARLRRCFDGAAAVIHTATLHKPHIATHSGQQFVDTNVSATLAVLEEAVSADVGAVVFTSTTSAFGRANSAAVGVPAAWITESVASIPKNIYGVTKTAAEDLCELVSRRHQLAVVILRTSRFFPEADDDRATREGHDDANIKLNELLYRRVDVADVVTAHQLAVERAASIGFGRYIVSATTPFVRDDAAELGVDAPAVVRRRVPELNVQLAKRPVRAQLRGPV